MTSTDPSVSQLPDWVAAAALGPFWAQVRARLEANGLSPRGRLAVVSTSREERHALAALLGGPVTRDRVLVDLAGLDARLSARSGRGGLLPLTAAVTGSRLRDRTGERAHAALRRSEPLVLGRSLLQGPWVEPWLAGLRRTGLLTNRGDAASVVTDAARVLRVLADSAPAAGRSRVELGARLVGDAHALDDDRLLGQVVLRALAAKAGVPVPGTAAQRRALWDRYGVGTDLVSATCLVLGLRPGADSADPGVSRRMRLAAEAGDPVHLTGWDLRKRPASSLVERTEEGEAPAVLVCENPRILEALADRHGGRFAAVCTSGEPNTVVGEVLAGLREAGARLRYHGDFDWPGVAIANRLVAAVGVEPWRMGAADYEAALPERGLALTGTPVEPVWDAELGAAMRAHRTAVHEEAVLDQLLDQLLAELPDQLPGSATAPGNAR